MVMARLLKGTLRWGLLLLCCWGLWACQPSWLGAGDRAYHYQPPSQDGIGKVYMGREIAQVMGHEGAYWLERPSRELQERPQRVIDRLALAADAIVADIGAGTGYMTQRLARATPEGKVFAVDIQPEMIDLLTRCCEEDSLTHIEPVLGTEDDPHLPADSLDLVLMVDAYHEFAYPREMIDHLRDALKPGGQVVLAEYRTENPLVLIKRLHKMSEKQVKREMAAAGLQWLKTDDSGIAITSRSDFLTDTTFDGN